MKLTIISLTTHQLERLLDLFAIAEQHTELAPSERFLREQLRAEHDKLLQTMKRRHTP